MKLRNYIIIFLFLLFGQDISAQIKPGRLSGKVTDKSTREELLDAIVRIELNGRLCGGARADYEGNYSIENLQPGKYKVIASYIGKRTEFNDVLIESDSTRILNIEIDLLFLMSTTEIQCYKVPHIEKDNVGCGIANSKNRSRKRLTRNPKAENSVTKHKTNLYVNEYYVDGLRVKPSKKSQPEQSNPYFTPNVNTESYDKTVEQMFLGVRKHPLSTFSIDVDNASYTNARRILKDGAMPPKESVRIEEFINYFSFQYPQPEQGHPFSFTTHLAPCPWNSEHLLLRIGIQGKQITFEEMPPMNLVFLIDVSGSMNDEKKLPLLKRALLALTEKLRPQDQVSIVVYAGSAGLILPCTQGGDKTKMVEALENLRAGGSTAGGEGLELAYKTALAHFKNGGINRIILATDGDFNVGCSSDEEMKTLIENKRKEGVAITVLGFGMGNLKDSKMEAIADHGNGNYFYIDSYDEAIRVLVDRIDGTLYTIASDVKLQLEFNPVKVKEYRLIGYDNRKLKKEDFNNDKKDAGDLGAGHKVTALYEIIPAGSVEEVDELKYGKKPKVSPEKEMYANEWLTVKFRYKLPGQNLSQRMMEAVTESSLIPEMDADFKFCASVAAFGMLLKDSKYKGNASYPMVKGMVSEALSYDPGGYRSEFLNLVTQAERLSLDNDKSALK